MLPKKKAPLIILFHWNLIILKMTYSCVKHLPSKVNYIQYIITAYLVVYLLSNQQISLVVYCIFFPLDGWIFIDAKYILNRPPFGRRLATRHTSTIQIY